MRLAPYAAALGLLLAILIIRAPPTFAQVPQQGGGGLIYGSVYGFTWDNELVPLEWVQVTAANANYHFVVSTGANGTFEMYVPVGTYNLTVSPPGYVAHSSMISVSDGSSSTASFYLDQSHVPVPEFPAQTVLITMIMALAVTLLTRRAVKRKN